MATEPIVFDIKKVVRDPEVNPLAIADAMDLVTDKEWREWLVEACAEEAGVKGSQYQQQRDKLMAVQVGLTNPDVFDEWTLFNACCIAFNHRRSNFEWLDKPSYLELAWGCEVLRGLNQTATFGPQILRFIGAIMLDDGLAFFPWIGGDGIVLCEEPEGVWAKGVVDDDLCALGKQVRSVWESGPLKELAPGRVDDNNTLHVQLAQIVAAQEYIRSQKPRTLEAYS